MQRSILLKVVLMFLFFHLGIMNGITQVIRYVTVTGSGSQDGSSWWNAYPADKLQDAINIFGANQVWVAEGTYRPTEKHGGNSSRFKTFQMKNGIAIYGGFKGTEFSLAQRDLSRHFTVLSGDIGDFGDDDDNCYHVFYHPDGRGLTNTAILDGFTILGGNADSASAHSSGGGMKNDNNSPLIRNCNFRLNIASDNGGAVFNDNNSHAVFENCTFHHNIANWGGAIRNSNGSNPTIKACRFFSNTASTNGGAIYNYKGTTPQIINSLFYDNIAIDRGGAIANFGASPIVVNCTFANNTANKGGGIANCSHTGSLPYPSFNNCIIYYNLALEEGNQFYISAGGTTLNYTCYSHQGGDIKLDGGSLTATNHNISDDPLFIDESDDDYRLMILSPCIDKGNNSYNDETDDIRGKGYSRKLNIINGSPGIIDLGCYEYNINMDPAGPFDGGDGSQGDPFQVANAGQLNKVRDYLTSWFIQTADINLSGYASGSGWMPIGTSSARFKGHYNGGGHTIENLTINRPSTDNIGLFGYAEGAEIRNLFLKNVHLVGDDFVGSLAGLIISSSAVSNCHAEGSIQGRSHSGGLIGSGQASNIFICSASVSVNSIGNYSGGLAGHLSHATLWKSYATGVVVSTLGLVGGLVGWSDSHSVISNCHASGSVTGTTDIGGLAGKNQFSSIVYCYSTGFVEMVPISGGLVGAQVNATVTSSFFDLETSGHTSSQGGLPMTTADMKTLTTYTDAGWDFTGESANGTDDIWYMGADINEGYPVLAWQLFTDGEGTADHPYKVGNPFQLYHVRDFPGAHFIQVADIDLSAYASGEGWLPIGNATIPFSGVYDGQGHTIDNLAINRITTNDIGLFGYCQDAVLKNVVLTQADVTGYWGVGTLLGGGIDCAISNCHSSGTVDGNSKVGGLIGLLHGSSVDRCYSHGSVSAGSSACGGLLGWMSDICTVANCYSSCSVYTWFYPGGLVGQSYTCTVLHCYSTGEVTGHHVPGGLVGSQVSSTIMNSYWNTETSGQSSSAGGTGKTTLEMKTYLTYSGGGWDMVGETANGSDEIWYMAPDVNEGYPTLEWREFFVGKGTAGQPYEIRTPLQLYSVRYYPSAYYIQMADIDLGVSPWNEGAGWVPIGESEANPFNGVYRGNGFSVSNLMINDNWKNYAGLFGQIDHALISDLAIINASVLGNTFVGSLAGAAKESMITGCHSSGMVTGKYPVGGLTGTIADNSILSCCYSLCNVSGMQHVGGLTGSSSVGSSITNCYAMGSVHGTHMAGGLAGLVLQAEIRHCYSTGAVTGSDYFGGLVGQVIPGDGYADEANFWDITTSGIGTSLMGLGKTTNQMKLLSTFTSAGWDFWGESVNGRDDPWMLDVAINEGYPSLSRQWFDGCNGTADCPYHIKTPAQLYNVRYAPSAYFIQVADINLSGYAQGEGWLMIRSFSTPFKGHYDGQGHVIDSLTINMDSYGVGLFGGILDAEISNLTLKNVHISQGELAGALVGHCVNSSITNCSSSGIIRGTSHLGGLVGHANASRIAACFSSADVAGTESFNGGLVGEAYSLTEITDCYANGPVSGFGSNGGLVGGMTNNSYVNRCYSNGPVACIDNAGGLIGSNANSRVDNSFWDTITSGRPTSAGGTPRSSTGMHLINTFLMAGWDFQDETLNGSADTWGINDTVNQAYPFLSWQGYLSRVTPPVVQAHDIGFSEIQRFQMTVNWKNGEGMRRVVFMKQASSGTTAPLDQTDYADSTLFAAGTEISPGWYCVYNGCDTAVTVTGLNEDTEYIVQVFEYNNDVVSLLYLTDTAHGNPQVQRTIGFAGGDGTPGNPFLITFPRHLNCVRYFPGASYLQLADLDLSGFASGQGWEPIGNVLATFTGKYDGNCYNIKKMSLNRPGTNYAGLFGYVAGAEICNVDMTGMEVTAAAYVGGLAGRVVGASLLKNNHTSGNVTGIQYVGGLAGCCENSRTDSCFSSCVVTASEEISGGLLGQQKNHSSMTHCFAAGSVIGQNQAGGLVGWNFNNAVISKSFSTANVQGQSAVGGLVGQNFGDCTISNCFSKGNVSGTSFLGGLVGSNNASVITSYWDMQSSGQNSSHGGEGRSTAQMLNGTDNAFINPDGTIDPTNNPANAMYMGWSDDDWLFTGLDYPQLKYHLPAIICPDTIYADADTGHCYAVITDLGTPATNNNCTVRDVANNKPANDQYPVGLSIVTWIAMDIHGNKDSCDQAVIVTDKQSPVITCPQPVNVNADPQQCYATVSNLGTPDVSDNCGTQSPTNNAPANQQYPVGTSWVLWTVSDIHGNTAQCSQSVTVTDNQAPAITCPQPVNVNADQGQCYATVSNLGSPQTGDNCGVQGTTNNKPGNDQYPVGTTWVVWTVTDVHGNTAQCSQSVTVTDNQPPSITCPQPVNVNADQGQCYAIVTNLGAPQTGDNCGVQNISNNAPANQQYPVGTTGWSGQ